MKDYASFIHLDNQAPEAKVLVNRLLFTRALINLIENSAHAMEDQPEPQIWVRVARKGPGGIAFTVEDNGIGIDEDQLHTIWNRGISGRQSSGLGLAFVENVVDRMEGKIYIKSAKDTGTRICLYLPEDLDENE